MSIVKEINRKSMTIRASGRSSDFISPSFGYGCLLECSYCYMKRHRPNGLTIAKNTEQILTEINSHVAFADVDKPNQTDPDYITYDIACNEDFALHAKYHNWKQIFQFFKDHPRAKATLATKIIPEKFLEFNPEGKVRIRFSLMPQILSSLIEPNTPPITDRILAVNDFKKAGYDVHLNFSPVVIYDGWLEDYMLLFEEIDMLIDDHNKSSVLSEVIFLTHNEKKHLHNLENKIPGEELLWVPYLQEEKVSEYGGKNVRYDSNTKLTAIAEFRLIHGQTIPWNTIRYIF
jgi:spore photoproduct lyase